MPDLATTLDPAVRHAMPTIALPRGSGKESAVGADETRAALEQLPVISLHEPSSGTDATATEPSHADLTVTGLLGEGGMGRVLLARQRALGRDVAVKVLHPGGNAASLLAEARMTGQLEHPHIVPVHALGRDRSGRPVLVLKRIEGVRWSELLVDADHDAWTRTQARGGDRLLAHVQILMQVCNAVHFAHSRGVVHRDLKPDNVMIGAFGEVYVTDWGVAMRSPRLESASEPANDGELTASAHAIVGTPVYMAPEMVVGDPALVDARTDVFLLGATLHEVLTGERRHAGRTVQEALAAAFAVEPYAYEPETPAELAAIANRATASAPDARFESALALRDALASWVEHRGAATLCETALERLRELQTLVASESPKSADAEHHAEVQRLFAECRFGFREALRAWSEQPGAREGLQRALETALVYDLERNDVQAARHLVGEIDAAGGTVDPALRARIESLRIADERTRARAAELERLGREMDLSTASRERKVLFGVVGAASLVLGIYLSLPRLLGQASTFTYTRVLVLPVLWLIALPLAVLRWPQLIVNTANRRTVGMLALGMALIVANRLSGQSMGLPAASVVPSDNLIMLAVTAAGAMTINARLWPAPAAFAISWVCAHLMPSRPLLFFFTASGVMLLSLMRSLVLVPPDVSGNPPSQ